MRTLLAGIFVFSLALGSSADAAPQSNGSLSVSSSPDPSLVDQTVTIVVTGAKPASDLYLICFATREPPFNCTQLVPVGGNATFTRSFPTSGLWLIQVDALRNGRAVHVAGVDQIVN